MWRRGSSLRNMDVPQLLNLTEIDWDGGFARIANLGDGMPSPGFQPYRQHLRMLARTILPAHGISAGREMHLTACVPYRNDAEIQRRNKLLVLCDVRWALQDSNLRLPPCEGWRPWVVLLTAKGLETGQVAKNGIIGAICYQNAINSSNRSAQWRTG
jgi:hypothetical protein